LSLDFRNGIGAEVPVFSEAARHQHVAHHEKNDETDHEYSRQTEEMSCVFDVHSWPSKGTALNLQERFR
jgi:hypothetical protein